MITAPDFGIGLQPQICRVVRGELLLPPTLQQPRIFLLKDGLDPMPVRIDHESGIVIWAVIRSKSRSAIIGPTGSQSFGMERVYRDMGPRVKGQMKAGTGWANGSRLLLDRQKVSASWVAVASRILLRPHPHQPKPSEGGVIECDRALQIRAAE